MEGFENAFERAWPWIGAAALRRGEQTRESVLAKLRSPRRRLWVGARSAAVTEMIEYPSGLVVGNCWLAGGDLHELIDFTDRMTEWAKGLGATKVRLEGRPGWKRVLKGFDEISAVLERDVQ